MEFARKRRRRRGNPQTGRFVTALIAVCLVIYLITASAAGKWLAEKVMAPAFSALEDSKLFGSSSMDALEKEDPSLSVSLDSGRHSVSADVELPAIECFALQMGAFSSRENASAMSDKLIARGAGGYVYDDGNVYRVLASCYNNEGEARAVKERLINEGSDCAVYTISSPAVTLSVTAKQDQMDELKQGFYALYDAQADLCAACIEFDSKSMSPSEGASLTAAIRDELASACKPLSEYGDSSAAIQSMSDCCESCLSSLDALTEGSYSDSGAFSAKMKYTLLELSDAYSAMLKDIAR